MRVQPPVFYIQYSVLISRCKGTPELSPWTPTPPASSASCLPIYVRGCNVTCFPAISTYETAPPAVSRRLPPAHRLPSKPSAAPPLPTRLADASSSTILGPVPAAIDAATACHTVSFFHQPSLESEMRALFDSAPEAQTSCSGGDHADSIADVVDACCSGAPCARLIKGAEVKDVKMGDDGAASLSIKRCSHSSTRSPRAISCRLPIASARSSNNSSFPADFFWPPTARPAACARASTPFTQAVPHAGSGAPSIRN